MSPFISVTRRARRRPAPPVIALLLATTVLLASFALPAFGLSTTKLISEALSTAKKADKDAKNADKSAKSADIDAKNSSVGTRRLQDGAVTADKLASGAVGATQLATGGVTSVDLADGAVTGVKLASGSVGSSQIVPGSVSIRDLSGTSLNTTFDVPAVGPSSCSTAEVPDPGARITDFPMISFPGPTDLPRELSALGVLLRSGVPHNLIGDERETLADRANADEAHWLLVACLAEQALASPKDDREHD